MIFRFIGNEASVGSTALTKFGQPIQMSKAEGSVCIAGNLAILPDDEFRACGFTEQELLEYAYPGPRIGASEEFAAKWKAARLALHELREKLKADGVSNAEEKEG